MSQTPPTLAAQSSASFLDVLSVAGGLSFIVAFVFLPWVYTLVSVLRRDDLKESKLLWIVLLFVIGPIAPLLYAFMEDRKKFGMVLIAIYVVLPMLGIALLLLS